MVTKEAMNMVAREAKTRKQEQFIRDVFSKIERAAEDGKFSTEVLMDDDIILQNIKDILSVNGFDYRYDSDSYKFKILRD